MGFSVVPIFIYTFISPKDYTSRHSLTDAYTELLGLLFGKEGGGGSLNINGNHIGPLLTLSVYAFCFLVNQSNEGKLISHT